MSEDMTQAERMIELALAREYPPRLVEILSDTANHKPIGGWP